MSTTERTYAVTPAAVKESGVELIGTGTARVRLHEFGVEIQGELTETEWADSVERLTRFHANCQWAIGDLINYGERFGETHSQAFDPDYAPQTMSNFASVAKHIPPARRRHDRTWGHHSAVAFLDPEIADELLNQSVKNGWSVTRLREAVRLFKAALKSGKTTDVGKLGTPNLSDTFRRLAAKSRTWERLEYEAWREGRLAEHHSEVMRQLQPVQA